MNKRVLVILLFIMIHISFKATAGFAGTWMEDCTDGDAFPLVIFQTYPNAPYRIFGDKRPTDIITDSRFTVISNKELVADNKTYHRCTVFSVPDYEPANEWFIQKNIIGHWRHEYTEVANERTKQGSGRHPDLQFNEDGSLLSIYRKQKHPMEYSIRDDAIYFGEKGEKAVKVLLINEYELHLTDFKSPLEIYIYEKIIEL